MVADHSEHYLKSVRSLLSTAVYPLQLLAQLPVSVTDWTSEIFVARENLQEENRRLKEENLQLRIRQQKLEAEESENMRLRDLLQSSPKLSDRVLVAELVAVDLTPFRQQVLINKGSQAGAFEGQPVVDANAIIGQIIHVNPFTATVLMITDATHSLPVQVNRNGLRAIATGSGDNDRLNIPHLPLNADIRAGDLLVTSGLGGHFPAGYPVATVTAVSRDEGRSFTTVEATPNAKLDQIREVLLVWNLSLKPEEPLPTESPETPSEAEDPPQ